MVEPSLLLYLDLCSIFRLESSSCQFRYMEAQTSIYKGWGREVKQSSDIGLLERVDKGGNSKIDRSRHFRKKLSEYYLRNVNVPTL